MTILLWLLGGVAVLYFIYKAFIDRTETNQQYVYVETVEEFQETKDYTVVLMLDGSDLHMLVVIAERVLYDDRFMYLTSNGQPVLIVKIEDLFYIAEN